MIHSQQIRIQSDGLPANTVITLDDGTELPNIRSAFIHLDARDVPSVTLDIWMPIIDVHADAEQIEFLCPCCGEQLTHKCNSEEPDDPRIGS